MVVEPKERVADILKYPFKSMDDRNIRQETCERFGVRCAVSPEDGKTPIAFYYPSYNKKGKLVGFMKQDVLKDKSEKGHWTAIGSVSISNKLFGQDVAESVERAKKSLVCTEGQIDAMSMFQACKDRLVGTKFEGLEPHVVSIPLGTANASEAVLQNFNFVEQFDEFVCFFDNDSATPKEKSKGILKGEEAKESVLSSLVGTKVKLFELVVPLPHKDASDMLQAGQSDTLGRLLFDKKEYTPEKIIRVSDVTFESIITAPTEGVQVPQFPKLMEMTAGFHQRALTLVTSISGAGKSTAVSIVSNEIEKAGHKLGMIFLEEQKQETVQRLIAEKLKVNYIKFKRNPLKYASEDKIREVYNELTQKENIVLLDHFGSIPIKDLMAKIRYLHMVEGCSYIVLDHISCVISGLDVVDERKELDMVMTELAAFCAGHDVGIIVVCHLNRQGTADQLKPPKGKEDEPFWVRVTKESLRGSSALEQLSWNILGLEPEINPDRSRGRVRWVVLKNRSFSYLGQADVWKLNEQTWEVECSEESEF